jgi:hypothetical protein
MVMDIPHSLPDGGTWKELTYLGEALVEGAHQPDMPVHFEDIVTKPHLTRETIDSF